MIHMIHIQRGKDTSLDFEQIASKSIGTYAHTHTHTHTHTLNQVCIICITIIDTIIHHIQTKYTNDAYYYVTPSIRLMADETDRY
jgi:hypothetical protein